MGGAIALGHPLGATGAIRAATVVHALRRRQPEVRHGHDVRGHGAGRGGHHRARSERGGAMNATTLAAPTAPPLAVRFFAPDDGTPRRGAVLIGGAMGVRRDYRPFAEWLARRGFVVASFDYRGMGESRPAGASLREVDVDLFDWAADTDTVIEALAERAGGLPIVLIGHSLGAQLPGLLRHRDRLAGLLSVAAGSGYWRDNAPRLRLTCCISGTCWCRWARRCSATSPAGVSARSAIRARRGAAVAPLVHAPALPRRRRGRCGARALRAARFPVVALSITDDETDDRARRAVLVDCYANAPRRIRRMRRTRCRRAASATSASSARTIPGDPVAALRAACCGFHTHKGDKRMSIKTATLNGVATIRSPAPKNALTVAMYQAMADALNAAQADPAVRGVDHQPARHLHQRQRHRGLHEPPARLGQRLDRVAGVPVHARAGGHRQTGGGGRHQRGHRHRHHAAAALRPGLRVRQRRAWRCLSSASAWCRVRLQPGGAAPARQRQGGRKLLLGDPFTPEEAVEARIANAVLPAGEGGQPRAARGRRFNALPPGAVRETKLLRRAGTDDVLKTIAIEGELFSARLRSRDDGSLPGLLPEAQAGFLEVLLGAAGRHVARAQAGPCAAAGGAGAGDAAPPAVLPGRRRARRARGRGRAARAADRRRFVGGRRRRGHAGGGARRSSHAHAGERGTVPA